MADFMGRLSEAEVRGVIDWISDHWGSPDRCPMHDGAMTWGVASQLVRVDVLGFVGAKTVPLVVVSCDTCGYVAFLSAVKLGLTKGEPLS